MTVNGVNSVNSMYSAYNMSAPTNSFGSAEQMPEVSQPTQAPVDTYSPNVADGEAEKTKKKGGVGKTVGIVGLLGAAGVGIYFLIKGKANKAKEVVEANISKSYEESLAHFKDPKVVANRQAAQEAQAAKNNEDLIAYAENMKKRNIEVPDDYKFPKTHEEWEKELTEAVDARKDQILDVLSDKKTSEVVKISKPVTSNEFKPDLVLPLSKLKNSGCTEIGRASCR